MLIPNYIYATVKYDTNGTQLWVNRYGYDGIALCSRGRFDHSPFSMAVDGSYVYLTGRADQGQPTYADYLTLKLNASNGSVIWASYYNGPGNGDDVATAIGVDASGNVYVTGTSDGGAPTYFDWATIKYSPLGSQLWVARYDGSAHGYDTPYALKLDGSGNVYVTGSAEGIGTLLDYTTIKYDTNGTLIWMTSYNGPGNGVDEARSMAIDAAGNVYVTGES